MCGILIIHSKKKKISKNICLEAARDLLNRGPDIFKYEFFEKENLFISNTVLSITGEDKKNRKLLRSKSKRFVISFNGEIYNYKDFQKNHENKKNTDTKTLVDLYDSYSSKVIPNMLNGMYVYAVYDNLKKNVQIVNDPQGEKNLYYYNDENYFIASSKISTIIKVIKTYSLNESAIKNYFLTRHYMPFEETCFSGIRIFKNAHIYKYSINSNKIKASVVNEPINWISKKKYLQFKKMKEVDVINFFEDQIINQLKLMIPNKRFGCIVSGGVDSSLQSKLVNTLACSSLNLALDFGSKDPIMRSLYRFNNFFDKKIVKKRVDQKLYKKLANKCYDVVSSPLQTHDLPGRYYLSKIFKKNKCKVFFSADGCDELFGGQQVYLKCFKKKFNSDKNSSPYSSIVKNKMIDLNQKKIKSFLNGKWKEINKKYSFIKSLRERSIQSSLYLDYFLQSISVANRSNDLICCENSVEPRNVFIQKNILKIILNLPLKYKFNENANEKLFKQKYILKKIFIKYFPKNLIFKKSGFSGYPNSLKEKKIFAKSKLINTFLLNKNRHIARDLEWKIINTEGFLNKYF